MKHPRASTPDEVMRARRKGERLAAAVRALPREVKADIKAEIREHAPVFGQLIKEFDATPLLFHVRDGDGWCDVLTPEIVRQHTKRGTK